MPTIEKQIRSELKGLNQSKADIVPVPVALMHLRPGNLVHFSYTIDTLPTGKRLCLIVKNDTGRISYLSMRDNILLSCFRLSDAPKFVLNFILKRVYNRTKLAERQIMVEGLEALLGKLNYRTYKISNIYSLHKIYIDRKALPDDEDLETEEE
jgi:hypothetical protein